MGCFTRARNTDSAPVGAAAAAEIVVGLSRPCRFQSALGCRLRAAVHAVVLHPRGNAATLPRQALAGSASAADTERQLIATPEPAGLWALHAGANEPGHHDRGLRVLLSVSGDAYE